ncbi:sensor histidine kinase [Sediminivirga luteola]|uniref:Signal transduction histidine kinase subgroup 3 dimerisation and phosphoacceptor domain-containing protein n=1 Tax=Sediminivirga luteola TaxID=1774748 RepID=A0A8J2U1C9_9MICO|nr:histidine kinase [Sediminivirga luteola]GGA27950.1 hypothetical protein GCM10011333_33390 [Sediminivirga luteola]
MDGGSPGGVTRAQIRRWTTRGYVVALLATALVSVLTSSNPEAMLLIVPSLALAAAVLFSHERVSPKLVGIAMVVGYATFAWAAVTGENAAGSAGVGICIGIWLMHRRSLILWVLALASIPLVASTAFLGDLDIAWRTALLLLLMAGVWIATVVDAESQKDLVLQLERMKDRERELSLLRERDRFAADLHDIQGHSLHAIKLKAALAERMLPGDANRAAAELGDIRRLAAEAIGQGRQLAAGTHRLNLAAELQNARELLLAAGIGTVQVELEPGLDPDRLPRGAEFAQVLREATTNIVRHARRGRVTITLTPNELTVVNNGAPPSLDGTPPLRGLAALAGRIDAAGGRLTAEARDDLFTVRVHFPPECDR